MQFSVAQYPIKTTPLSTSIYSPFEMPLNKMFPTVCFLLVLFVEVSVTSGKVYYVKPTSTTPCPSPNTQCYTLQWFAYTSRHIFGYASRENVTLMFLPGVHEMSGKFEASNSRGVIVLKGTSSAPVTIKCKNEAYFNFYSCKFVMLDGLEFSNCGGRRLNTESLLESPQNGLTVSGAESFAVLDCIFRGTIGASALVSRWGTDTVIYNSTFHGNLSPNMIRDIAPVMVRGSSYNDKSILRIHGCLFYGNKGYYRKGGSLYIDSMSDATINNTLFRDNSGERGGGVYAFKSRVSIVRVTFRSNIANEYCGGLYVEDSHVNISSGMFINNTAMFHAAACAVSSEVNIFNSLFNVNRGVNGTGGLFSLQSDVRLINSTFLSNRGYDGGALDIKKTTLTAQNTAFLGNMAQHSGGAVYAVSSSVTFWNETVFRDNKDPLGTNIAANKSRIVFPDTFSV